MSQNNCIFCKIVKGEIPSYKIWENDKFYAFLDIFPNTKGMTLLITKEHYDSYAFDLADEVYIELLLFAKKLGKHIDKTLGVNRTALVMEGMGVNHVHVKLYPLHGLGDDFKPMIPEGEHFYEKYQGYLTTLLGPRATDAELTEIQKILQTKSL
jgi:diadenosine tetraphosphate (Ap4A) HIT family hydrolase